ncbi:ATP-dependent helicase [Saezia sanguinis]|uniref:ATP-dependent helicase n=1 Tax=Saezia sanguinis TaxID=1965230 RepID=UPI003050E174
MSNTLNLAQSEAVEYLSGPCLVLAGAGSGKTRVITYKIARLIRAGLEPAQIAAITFTNKAAAEMRERARQLVGSAARELVICTFHALGVRMLRKDGALLGLKPQFSIMDADDVLSILRDVGSTTDVKQARSWQWQISLWKNNGLNAADAAAQAESKYERNTALIMLRYQERLSAYQAVDFDDLIGLPLRLLQEHASAREEWQSRLRHILVDEYQDTNATQYALLKLLVGTRARFTAVGDDDQSIYGWRGATLDNLKQLPQDFEGLKVIKLEQNYRSTSAILRAANAVIQTNPKLFEKQLWSELGEGEAIRVVECDHDEHEAERTISRIKALQAQYGCQWKDFAILYRANHQARVFEQVLRRHQMPYKVSGGQSFFDRAEIRDLCAWLRLIVNNHDDPAFLRAVTTPKRGIGHQTLSALGAFAGKHKISLFEALFSPSLPSVLSAKAIAGLHEFGRYINQLEYRARHTAGYANCRTFLQEWLQDIHYEQHLYHGQEQEKVAQARWQNVLDFCDWLASRSSGASENDTSHEPQSLMEIAQTISLIISLKEGQGDENLITLSTLHASKGLEWPHVLLVGVNEGTLPMLNPDDGDTMTPDRLQEERRLMYVGITRARQTLTVSHVRRKRQGHGSASRLVATKPSRFIAEMQLKDNAELEDPLAKIRALRAEFAARAANNTDPAP